MNTIGRQDLHIALAHHTQDVLEGNWQVAEAAAAGATTFTVSLTNPAAITPNVGASDAGNFSGARIVFWGGDLAGGGSLNRGFSTEVASVSSAVAHETLTTTVTVKDALPAALAAGDTFTIYRTMTATVTASENIAEVGGTPVPSVAGGPRLPTAPAATALTTLYDASGSTDAAAGTSTVALAADEVTQYLFVQNASTTSGDNLWVNFGADATAGAGSVLLGPGASLVFEQTIVPKQSVNVLSPVASLPYTLKYA